MKYDFLSNIQIFRYLTNKHFLNRFITCKLGDYYQNFTALTFLYKYYN